MTSDEKTLPSDIDLVRFDRPELVANKPTQNTTNQNVSTADKTARPLDGAGDLEEELSVDDVLSRIMPMREWEADGKFFRQRMSNRPATKLEVKKLSDKLDMYLEQFKAREVGLCSIKRELYGQCFNEIIRQVTLNCSERGYLLIQIRDELNMTIEAYQELYESIIANGIRKALLKEHKTAELEKKAAQLRANNETLEAELAETTAATKELERDLAESREAEAKRRVEEVNTLKKANQAIKAQIEAIIAPKKVTS